MTAELRVRNLIGGELRDPIGGAWIPDFMPSTGKLLADIPDSDERDIDAAVQAAKKAFPSWSRMPASERSRWL
ncbi:MAG: aldehyde dehydrogenase family protein, partial [Thermoanaerobaculia bacterium]